MICYEYGISPRQLDGVTQPEWQAMIELIEEVTHARRRHR